MAVCLDFIQMWQALTCHLHSIKKNSPLNCVVHLLTDARFSPLKWRRAVLLGLTIEPVSTKQIVNQCQLKTVKYHQMRMGLIE